jgi:group I intron endonuclease
MSKITGVYAIICKVDGKRIIGSCGDIKRRWSNYKTLMKQGRYGNKNLQAAVNKFGISKFDFVLLEECSSDKLFARELAHTEKYEDDELYNIRKIKNTDKKIKTKAEAIAHKEKMSAVMSGENNPRYQGRLLTEDVVKIKLLMDAGLTNKEIHEQYDFDTSYNMISRIRTENRYASVNVEDYPNVSIEDGELNSLSIKHFVDEVNVDEAVI